MSKFLSRNKIVIIFILGVVAIAGATLISSAPSTSNSTGTLSNSPKVEGVSLKDKVVISEIVDGDTVVTKKGRRIRLLGIDADERGKRCFLEAKQRLQKLVKGEQVRLKKGENNKDKYDRFLRFLFKEGVNINKKLVKEGLVETSFMPEQKLYKEGMTNLEEKARENNTGCEWSEQNPIKENLSNDKTSSGFSFVELTKSNTGLSVINPCSAADHIGEKIIIEGRPIGTYYDESSNTAFINFGKPYPDNCFTAVVFSSNLQHFSENPADLYRAKFLRIQGTIKEHKDKPEIIIKNPSQVEVGKSN